MKDCGTCSACCLDLRIGEKAPGTPCAELEAPGRCRSYDRRPKLCRQYECLWRLLEGAVLDDGFRPDRCGAVFTPKLASELGLPPNRGGDWLVIAAEPALFHYQADSRLAGVAPTPIVENRLAWEAVRRLRVAGLFVSIGETRHGGGTRLEGPLREVAAEFAHYLAEAMERRNGNQ